MHLAKLYFFFIILSFLSYLIFVFTSDYPIIFRFSLFKSQPTRAIEVMCDGGVYPIDVDVDVDSIR